MSITLRALVALSLGVKGDFAPGELVELPDGQQVWAEELLAFGLAERVPAAPVKVRRRAPRSAA
ncbi:hypothetical protein [Streptomyces sp. NPDC088752]|uniref:hypothetical protein n=1 Tax=Streptomyces sp. NPDC088752 TaxID=3154963 RepID=UPI00344672C0